jgi:hypothetical protein
MNKKNKLKLCFKANDRLNQHIRISGENLIHQLVQLILILNKINKK